MTCIRSDRSPTNVGSDRNGPLPLATQGGSAGPSLDSPKSTAIFELEDGHEIPPEAPAKFPTRAYPFPDMRPGQSFLAVGFGRSQVANAARMWLLRQPDPVRAVTSFEVRAVPGGTRCWMVAVGGKR
jgi:hypothetical protein